MPALRAQPRARGQARARERVRLFSCVVRECSWTWNTLLGRIPVPETISRRVCWDIDNLARPRGKVIRLSWAILQTISSCLRQVPPPCKSSMFGGDCSRGHRGHLGCSLGCRGRLLGGLLEALLGPVWATVGGLLESSWGFSEASWAPMGAFSGNRIELSVYVPPLGPLRGLSWDNRRFFRYFSSRFQALLGRSWAFWGPLEASWGALWAPGAVSVRRELDEAIT